MEALDLSAILQSYRRVDGRGGLAYHPMMLVKLLVYRYCTGRYSSRRIERATWEDVPFRVLSGNQQPDHDSIAHFRKRHLQVLAGLFVQVLDLCHKAGLVKLGHVAVDGTKIKANASKHKAMSYERLVKAEGELSKEVEDLKRRSKLSREELVKTVEALLDEADRVDAEEDALYGKGKRGDEVPEELKTREGRLKKIREAMAALEAEAKVNAQVEAEAKKKRVEEREQQEKETGKKIGGKKPTVPDPQKAVPLPRAQRNFTDPDSRIMQDGATKAFQQSYNAQAAVDDASQIIVAAIVSQSAPDNHHLVPVLEQAKLNMGKLPQIVTADNGFWSPEVCKDESLEGVDLYIASGREKSGPLQSPAPATQPTADSSLRSPRDEMRAKLDPEAGRAIYRRRKAIVEPVFGQIKQARGFRQFLLRGFQNVSAEWSLVTLTHNLLKLFRSGWRPGEVAGGVAPRGARVATRLATT